jgi:hypothetical protein
MVAVPNQGWVHKYLTVFLMNLQAHREGHELAFNFRSDKPLDVNRNAICQEFYDNGYDYLFFIDDDNPPVWSPESDRHENPLKLIEKDLDIVGLPTPFWNAKTNPTGKYPIVWNAFDFESRLGTDGKNRFGETKKRCGLVEVDAVGTGAIIIARRVFDHPDMRPPFVRPTNEWGGTVKVGADLHFCERAKEAGFKVWNSWDHPCNHLKEVDLTNVHLTMQARDVSYAEQTNINTAEYWDGEWAKREERILPFYEKIVEDVLERTDGGGVVLDYGCGRGDLLQMMTDAEIDCCGADISEKAVDICRERGLRAMRTDDTVPRPRDLFERFRGMTRELDRDRWDVIVCTEVLEHIKDHRAKIRELLSRCDLLIYSVPLDCLPPGLEREHLRVYTESLVRQVTPDLRHVELWGGTYIIVYAGKPVSFTPEGGNDAASNKIDDVPGGHQGATRRDGLDGDGGDLQSRSREQLVRGPRH